MGDEKPEENHILKAFVACRDALVRSVLKMYVRQEDVDDILQETYLRVLHADEKTPVLSPQDYLFVVSRNLVIEKLSRRSREINMEISDALAGSDDVPLDRTLHYRRKFELFNEALRALPEKQRRAILLRKFYGLSHQEIAGKMHTSVSSVEKYIASGIKQCKRKLRAQGYESDGHAEEQVQAGRQEAGNGIGEE